MPEPSTLHRPLRGVSAAERQKVRRRTLIESGLELFGTRGIAAVTIEEICRHANLNKRYFYESFASVDELAIAVVNKILEDIGASLIPLVASGGGIRNPRAGVTHFVRTVMSDPRLARLLFVEADAGGLAHQRQRFIDLAVDMWVGADPAAPDDPRQLAEFRMGAYGYGGACREIILATITGRLDFTADEVADYLTRLLERISAQPL